MNSEIFATFLKKSDELSDATDIVVCTLYAFLSARFPLLLGDLPTENELLINSELTYYTIRDVFTKHSRAILPEYMEFMKDLVAFLDDSEVTPTTPTQSKPIALLMILLLVDYENQDREN